MTDLARTFDTDHGVVTLSPAIVRQYLVNGQGSVTDQEVAMFLELCRYQRLNPFLREVYLIKYGSSTPATIVTGKEVFTRRAAKNPAFDGFEAGIVVMSGEEVIRREGALSLDSETLIGGWAKIYLKNQRVPVYAEASLKEYMRCKADGSPTKTWAEMPDTMIRKVALVQALREAFPEDLQGLYSQEEMPTSGGELPEKPVEAEIIDVLNPENITLDVAKNMVMSTGKHEGKALTELVKTDERYVEWYITSGSDEAVIAALLLLGNVWREYQAKHQAEPAEVAVIDDPDWLDD